LIIIFDANHLKLQGGSRKSDIALSEKQEKCKELLLTTWKPLLKVLSSLLGKVRDESNIQILLNSYQNFISVCGSVTCYVARDAFLESLCSFCLTLNANGKIDGDSLQEKNIQICKTLLNIAHCLGHILDVKSWYIILETMQRIEGVINSKRKKANAIQQSMDFGEIKQKVTARMQEYQIVEELNKRTSKQKQEDVEPDHEEEKKETVPAASHHRRTGSQAVVKQHPDPYREP